MAKTVLFVCNHNAGHSAMAEAVYNAYNRNPSISHIGRGGMMGFSNADSVNPATLGLLISALGQTPA